MIQPLFVFSDWGLLFLRMALAVILIAHGWAKFKGFKGVADWMGSIGFKPGVFWAGLVTALEFFGGILLLLGFFTQILSVLIAVQFLVIILKVNRGKGLVGGFEFDLVILGAAFALATLGGGAWSLDQFFGLILY